MKTFVESKANIQRKWYIVDAQNQNLGRMASRIAIILMGKHKPNYTPFLDTGDHVVVVNADRVAVTGRKREQKQYFKHTGYPGSIASQNLAQMLEKKPEFVIKNAIRLMLPKNRLGRKMLKKLKVYRDANHPHLAQQPDSLDVTQFQKIEKY